MKKQYIYPEMSIMHVNNKMHLLAGSVDIDLSEEPIIGDPGDAASREFFEEEDSDFGFKQILLILAMVFTGLMAYAQTPTFTKDPADAPDDGKKHAMTLYLNGGGTVIYNDVYAIDHVTYLPNIGMKVYLKNQAESIDYLYSQLDKIVYQHDDNANYKKFPNMWTDYPEAWRLEYPQLSENVSTAKDPTKSQIIVKRTTDYGITLSLEWDNSLVANRWSCYQLHAGNTLSNVSRDDAFKADDEVAVSSTLNDYKGSGFARGHLCPSADRLCSSEQNKQTFFLTNMQPQYTSHNSGLWGRLEEQVRNFAVDDNYTGSHCDTLYVVKAATITDKVTIDDTEVDGIYPDIVCRGSNPDHELRVPKYFYMALLHYNKSTNTYRAIAFWTNHISTTQQVTNLGDYTISIDELEKRTGIDFFCNLPDDIEEIVEAEEPNMTFWHLTKTNQ